MFCLYTSLMTHISDAFLAIPPSLISLISDGDFHITNVAHISDENLVTWKFAVTNWHIGPSLISYSDVV